MGKNRLSTELIKKTNLSTTKKNHDEINTITDTIHSKGIDRQKETNKAITIMVTDNFRKQLKKKVVDRNLTIKSYLINLIKKDLGIEE